ncbi:MAG: hypothetical protein IJY08_03640 [Clostridia bacterium]|nr:hypothetical protein [Clostridia bacterium]
MKNLLRSILIACLAVLMLVMFTACGGDDTVDTDGASGTSSQTEQQTDGQTEEQGGQTDEQTQNDSVRNDGISDDIINDNF